MGFLKRLFKQKRKKEATIYVPEFNSAPYAAYSLSRRSHEQMRSPPREPVIQITRERSREFLEPPPPSFRSRSPTPSLAPSTLLDVNPEYQTSQTSSITSSARTSPNSLTQRGLPRLPQSRDSFKVTVHGRVRHSSTEFPFANPPLQTSHSRSITPNTLDSVLASPVDEQPLPLSPGEARQLQRLRQDPSLTSLMNVWDAGGQPRAELFVNTPCAPKRRPTLRALLGSEPLPRKQAVPGSPEHEGDISWAERFLDECLGRGGMSSDSLHVPAIKDADKTTSTMNTSGFSEPNDPALSSMQVERGTLSNDSIDSEPAEEHSSEILSDSRLIRSPSKRASQVFKFLVDPNEPRARTPSGIQPLVVPPRRESSLQHRSPGISQTLTPSVFLDTKQPAAGPSTSGYKPLPTPPPSLSADERLRSYQSKDVPTRMPGEQRPRGGSLPLLSIEQFNQQYPDEEGDESILVTPSRPPKRSMQGPRQMLSKQSVPPLPTPTSSLSSRNGSYNKRQNHVQQPQQQYQYQPQHNRQRSQTLSRLDNPYLSSANPGQTRKSSSSGRRSPSLLDATKPPPVRPQTTSTSTHLAVPGRDFMASLRQRTASAVGSILSRPNKRYSDRFVAIEWDQYNDS